MSGNAFPTHMTLGMSFVGREHVRLGGACAAEGREQASRRTDVGLHHGQGSGPMPTWSNPFLGLHGDKYGGSGHCTPRPSLCSLGNLRALGQPLRIQVSMRLNSLLPWRQTARVLSTGLSGNPALSRKGYLEFWASADPRFGLQLHKSRLNFLFSDYLGP